MSILITGASGFVGKHLLKVLLEKKIKVKCLSTNPIDEKAVYNYKLNLNYGCLCEDATFLSDVNCIVHLAGLAHRKGKNAPSKEEYLQVNYHYPLKLAKLAVNNGVKRFVFISTIGVNGAYTKSQPFSTESLANPFNEYSKSKLRAELALKELSKKSALELVIVRPPLVYGFNAPGNFGFLIKLVRVLPFLPFGLLNNKRDFIYVLNLADMLFRCAFHPNAAGNTFLVSDNQTISLKEFTNAIAKGLGKKVYQLPIPVSFMKCFINLVGMSNLSQQLFENLQIDSTNVEKVLHWTPPFTIEESIHSIFENRDV